MANEIVKVDKKTIEEAQAQIELVVSNCDMVKLSELKSLEQAILLSRGIMALKRVLTQQIIEEIFMPLQGSQLGFLTDKDSGDGYDGPTVRNCWIQGFMWGLQPVNNEMNIIATKPYAAKNGLERKTYEAVTNLIIRPGVPVEAGPKTALLPMRAQWMFKGQRCELIKDITKLEGGLTFDERYAIRVNAGMGPDAVIGKAYRKLYRDILAQITHNSITLADGDVYDTTGHEMIDGPAPSPAPPEHDGKRVSASAPRAPAEKPTPPAQKPSSAPSNAKSALAGAEVKDIKRHAKEAGATAIVDACERILTRSEDFSDIGNVQAWSDENIRQRLIE